MRCKNCGWPNRPNETNCVKCNAPLVDESDSLMSGVGNDFREPQQDNNHSSLNQTVREDVAFNSTSQSANGGAPTSVEHSDKLCAKCGYPLRENTTKCPNCGSLVGVSVKEERGVRMPTKRITDTKDEPSSSSSPKPFGGTINPYMMEIDAEPSFILKPVKKFNERHDFDELEYEGKEIVLNRSNTEANNPSITSRQQAVIRRENNHWIIEDKSEQHTTFVQAAHPVELHDGDILLLGNRLFEFHE